MKEKLSLYIATNNLSKHFELKHIDEAYILTKGHEIKHGVVYVFIKKEDKFMPLYTKDMNKSIKKFKYIIRYD